MAIIFDFEAGKDFHFASAFAERFGRTAVNDRVSLPEMLGEGFIQEIYLDSGLSLCLHHYTLRQEFVLRRGASGIACGKPPATEGATNVLTMKFSMGKDGEVEFGTGNFFTELSIPPGENINFLVIVTTRQTLLQLLKPGREEVAMESIIRDNLSFVFYEGMTREMERALRQLLLIDETTKLPGLFYQTKAQELIYFLFARLLSRHAGASVTVNREDAEKIYRVRAGILTDLSSPPQLPALARNIGMSATRMKQLFRQIFGDSIYNYYQTARMNEAAHLLSHQSVSEVGYSVGFTNLSHFTRLFEKHHQMKPKRYKDSLEGKLSFD